jgi:hypothetical protein
MKAMAVGTVRYDNSIYSKTPVADQCPAWQITTATISHQTNTKSRGCQFFLTIAASISLIWRNMLPIPWRCPGAQRRIYNAVEAASGAVRHMVSELPRAPQEFVSI